MSPDPITTLRDALDGTWVKSSRDEAALAALEQVRTLVEAARELEANAQIWSIRPPDLVAVRKALQPFISGDTESG